MFLLYIAVVVRDGNKGNRFGYADDIAILSIGITAIEAVENAQAEVRKLLQLINDHEISFDLAKSDLLVLGGETKKVLDTADLVI